MILLILLSLLVVVSGRTTVGYIEARTQGDVHLLSSFRPTTRSSVAIDTEILSDKANWKVIILNGDALSKTNTRLEDCKCDCVENVKLIEADVKPVNGEWRMDRDIENPPGLLAVVLATCDVKRIHSGDSLIEYAVTWINNDGTHVSKEEIRERALIASFLVVYQIGTICFFYSWYQHYKIYGAFERQRKCLLYLFSASIWMYSMDLTCKYIHLTAYEDDGVGNPTLLYISMLFRTTSHSLFVLLLLFFPCIYADLSGLQKQQMSSMDVKNKKKMTEIDEGSNFWRFVNSYLASNNDEPEFKRAFHLFLLSYCVSNLWVSYEVSEQQYHQSRKSETWEIVSIFVSFVLEIAVYLVFAFRSLDVSNRAQNDRGIRDFFRTFIWVFTPLFVSRLVRLLLSAFCEPWSNALHYANLFWVFVFLLSFAFMGKILWPTHSNWILTDGTSSTNRGENDIIVPFGNILGQKLSKLIWNDTTPKSSSYSPVDEYDEYDDNAYDEIPGGMMAKLESF